MHINEPIISTKQQAEAAVYRWCIREGLEPARFTEITAELSKALPSGPVPESHLLNYIAHFVLSTKQAEEEWGKYAREAWASSSRWATEAVKHLAFVNGAGLAGTTALLGNSHLYSKPWLLGATACLGVGLILALLCMWLESKGCEQRAKDLDRRARAVKNSTTWKSYAEAQNEEYKDAGARWFKVSICTGWGSAGTAILGIICIVAAVA